MNLFIRRCLVLFLFGLVLTANDRAESQEGPARWIVRSYFSREDDYWLKYYQVAIPEGAGSPRLFYWPENRKGWMETEMSFRMWPKAADWFWLGMGGENEPREPWSTRRLESSFFMTFWHKDEIKLSQDWFLTSELETRCWFEPVVKVDLTAHQLFLGHQEHNFQIGPVLIGQFSQAENYTKAGLKIGYSLIRELDLSAEAFPIGTGPGPDYRLTAAISFRP